MTVEARQPSTARREAILLAARDLVLLQGLRATTMEAIAREARVAKPTLYSYFPDKDAVVRAIMTGIVADLRESFWTAMNGPGDVVDRIANAFADKHERVRALLAGSPHATELYNEHDRLAGGQFEQFDNECEMAIREALGLAGVGPVTEVTALLLTASYGVGYRAPPGKPLHPIMYRLVDAIVRPELPT